MKSLEIIFEQYEKPFIVLMNKFDRVKLLQKEEQFAQRKKDLENKYDQIYQKLTNQFQRHPLDVHGVFPVSAIPMQVLGSECPNKRCSKQTNEDDLFPGASICILVKDAALQCDACKAIYVLEPKPDTVDMEKTQKYAQAKGLYIIHQAVLPIGLNPRSNVIRSIIFFTNEAVSLALMKIISQDLSDHIIMASDKIREAIKTIYGKGDAVEVDRVLCREIAGIFDLEQSAIIHSEYEVRRWDNVNEWNQFTRFVRYNIGSINQERANYVAAWGIFYARKFHDIAIEISDNLQKDTSQSEIAEKCNEICAKYGENHQLEYYQFILEHSLEEAIDKYITKYTRSNISLSETFPRPKFGKT